MRDNAWLSILGLYKYDNHVFDDMRIPRAAELVLDPDYMLPLPQIEDLSRDTLIYKILMDLAELPLVYTDPDMLRYMIARWSNARTPIWRELWKTTLYKYVPIWNKDGTYEEIETGTKLDGHTLTTVTDQDTTGKTTTEASGSLDREIDHEVTGFDTDTYAADSRDITDEDTSTDSEVNESRTNDITETATYSGNGSTGRNLKHLEKGNIGVTTTQQMIKEQREIVLFDIYQVITDEFKKQFCLMIY